MYYTNEQGKSVQVTGNNLTAEITTKLNSQVAQSFEKVFQNQNVAASDVIGSVLL